MGMWRSSRKTPGRAQRGPTYLSTAAADYSLNWVRGYWRESLTDGNEDNEGSSDAGSLYRQDKILRFLRLLGCKSCLQDFFKVRFPRFGFPSFAPSLLRVSLIDLI